jgi:hypothetical protein
MTLEITNPLGYNIEQLPMTAKNGAGIFRVVVKAAYEILPTGKLAPMLEHPKTQLEDEYWGKPGESAMRRETDAALEKPFTDLLVVGHACAPQGRPTDRVAVGLSYGGRVIRKLAVTGDRLWFDHGAGWSMTKPKPFEKLPLSYDLAFGGMDDKGYEKRNPVGRGYASSIGKEFQGRPAPNVEHVDAFISSPRDRPEPGGVGVIGRDWAQRAQWAGTYDKAWLDDQFPLLPADFDARFNMLSHPDQWIKEPKPGDRVVVTGMHPNRAIGFELPDPTLYIGFFFTKKQCEKRKMHLGTILIDTDASRLELTWTSTVDVHGDPFQLDETAIDHKPVTPKISKNCNC